MILWVSACLWAGWWQATRAVDGNALSWVYAIEWPVFALGGIFGWWALLHTAAATPEQKAQRQAFEDAQRAATLAAKRRPEDEDDQLAAYNDHLAQLAADDRPEPIKEN
jgi:hypothetical protein